MKTLLLVTLITIGCGKEMGRVPFGEPGTAEEKVQLGAGEVSFWTELDVEWEGSAAARYEIQLLQKGDKVATASCDLLANPKIKLSWVETNIGGKHSRRGKGKLDCTASLSSGGETTVRVKLKASDLTLKRADLILKQ